MTSCQTRKTVLVVTATAAVASVTILVYTSLKNRLTKRRVLRVQDLYIYPLKSAREVRVRRATVTWRGLESDRIFQVCDSEGKFVTPRDSIGRSAAHPSAAALFHVGCEIIPGERLILSKLDVEKPFSVNISPADTAQNAEVKTEILGAPRPDDNKELMYDYGNAAAEWLEEATGIKGCRLRGIGQAYNRTVAKNPTQGDEPLNNNLPVNLGDEAPLLLVSSASLTSFRRRLLWSGHVRASFRVDMRRFRPNIVVHGTLPWEEDTWSRIRIGQVEFHVWQRCGRCLMTAFDRDTLERDACLQWLRSFRERCGPGGDESKSNVNFGMHLVPTKGCPNDIAAGNILEVLERDPEREREWLSKFGPKWKLSLRFNVGLA